MVDMTRRNVLAAGAVGVAGVSLAACGSGADASGDEAATAGTPGQSASPASTGQALVATAEVPSGGGVIIPVAETAVVVTQPSQGEYVGLSAVCPHQGCLCNEVADGLITCPCHGSQFSITDGAVVRGPATTGLEPVPVSVDGDQVVLG